MPNDLPTHIALDAASNLRDLGGWPTRDGRRVRRGVVFRAPALVALTPADEATIAALGIRTACDLRGVDESAAFPVAIAGARVEKLPIEPTVGASLKDILRTAIATDHVAPDDIMGLLRTAYESYALSGHAQYRVIFDLLRTPENLPLLFHCSAGKDRTGFGAALLLTALGVAWDDVLADYLATNALWRREIVRALDLPQAVHDTLLRAHPELLAAAFAAIEAEYGSTDAYLARAMGLDDAGRAALQAGLLTG